MMREQREEALQREAVALQRGAATGALLEGMM